MPISPGDRFGHYEVVAPLGAGGMGEVYRARDSRLGRDVALKVLPAHAAGDAQLKERFVREAQIVSSLNHPHICTLHDVGSDDTTSYLVMELLEGETLAQRLERGPMKVDAALRTASEIASALDRAHRAGIVHRDLKPSNVMLTRGGAKVLDFGIAKLTDRGSAASTVGEFPTALPTRTTPLTASGSIVGTLSYMAPEQLEGKEIDHRADIFSFGALLYEMVTGKRAFDGKSQASVIAAVLERDPPPASSVVADLPPSVDRLIRECLAKAPDDRRQSAHDLASDLRSAMAEGTVTGPRAQVPHPRTVPSYLPWTIAILALLGAAAAFALRPKQEGPPVMESAVAIFATDDIAGWPAVSPDGSAVAYVDYRHGEETRIRIRRLDDAEPRVVESTSGARHPFWSPTGRELAYFASERLWVVSAAGGRPRDLCATGYGVGGAWFADGTIVFASSFNVGLQRVAASGGAPAPLTTLDAARGETGHLWPVAIPGSRTVLFLSRTVASQSNRIESVPLDRGGRTVVAEADALAGYSAPWLLFVRGGVLLAQRFSPEAGRVSGEPRMLFDGVAFDESWAATQGDVAGDVLAWTPHRPTPVRGEWLDEVGLPRGTVFEDKDIDAIRLSPDGSKLALLKEDPQRGADDLWVLDLARSVRTRLTTTRGNENDVTWLPSGDEILYTSDDDGPYALRRIAADGSTPSREVVREADVDWGNPSVCPDGRTAFVERASKDVASDLWRVDLSAPERREAWLLLPESWEQRAACSPDGQWVAFDSDRSGDGDVYVRRVSGGASVQLSVGGGFAPRWGPDGKAVWFVSAEKRLKRVPLRFDASGVHPGTPVDIGADTRDVISASIASDGRILVLRRAGEEPAGFRVVAGWKRRLR